MSAPVFNIMRLLAAENFPKQEDRLTVFTDLFNTFTGHTLTEEEVVAMLRHASWSAEGEELQPALVSPYIDVGKPDLHYADADAVSFTVLSHPEVKTLTVFVTRDIDIRTWVCSASLLKEFQERAVKGAMQDDDVPV